MWVVDLEPLANVVYVAIGALTCAILALVVACWGPLLSPSRLAEMAERIRMWWRVRRFRKHSARFVEKDPHWDGIEEVEEE